MTQPNTSTATIPTGDNVSEIQSLTTRVQEIGRSFDTWNSVYVWLVFAAVMIAAAVFFAQFVSIRKGKQLAGAQSALLSAKDANLAGELKAKDLKIADAVKAAGEANERAGLANERASVLESGNLHLRADLERSKADAAKAELELRKYLDKVAERQADRAIDSNKLIELLKGKAQSKVLLLYTPNDSEAWRFAREIYWWLGSGPSKDRPGAGWAVSSPKPTPPNSGTLPLTEFADAPPAMRFDGAYSTSGITFIVKSLRPTPPALEALQMALGLSMTPLGGHSAIMVESADLPDDLIVVVVGTKPTWLWGLEKLGKR